MLSENCYKKLFSSNSDRKPVGEHRRQDRGEAREAFGTERRVLRPSDEADRGCPHDVIRHDGRNQRGHSYGSRNQSPKSSGKAKI